MNISDDKYVMVLPGTVWQIPLIKRIKELGYKTVVVHPYQNAVAFDHADAVALADILDRDACLKIAQNWNVCAVMSDECDIATPTLAYISEKMGLPSQGQEMSMLFTNKYLMREFCKTNGFPTPEYRLCYNLEEAIEFYREINNKMIIKPVDANSSRGVFTIDTEADLESLFIVSLKYSHHTKAVICERYISGPEFSVDGIQMPTGHVSLVISEKKQFSYNMNLDSELYFSYYNENYNYDMLRSINNELVSKTLLPFGFTHAEYKYEDGQFYLLEIGARGGGNLISSHVVPALTGIDNYAILVDQFVSGTTKKKISIETIDRNRVAALVFFDTTESGGIVDKIEGVEYLTGCPDILYYQFNFKIGDFIKRPTDGSNRIGFYIACCKNRKCLNDLIQNLSNVVKISYKTIR